MQKVSPDDLRFMRRALALARRGRGLAHPNPLVGAVLVRKGRILAEGHYARFGGPHAEAAALRRFDTVPAGSTLYVSLEPCSITGKTPPCTDLLLAKKVRRVVVGSVDANPRISGRGLRRLKRAGVRVISGVLGAEAAHLNRDFSRWIVRGTPYVTVKVGQSLDGAIATGAGQSKWITSEASRRVGMELRADADAVLVGVHTVLRDDPRLTVRLPGFRGNPYKIVLDPGLRTPRRAKLFDGGARVLLVVSPKAPRDRRRALAGRAELLEIPALRNGCFDWNKLLSALGRKGLTHILVEGGGKTIGSAFDAGVVQEAHFFVAPLVIGGEAAVRSVAGRGARLLRSAPRFRRTAIERIGEDLHVTGTC